MTPEAIRAGDIRAAARLISAIERGDPGLEPLLAALWRMGGRARLIGLTGPPGAGKSTLANRMIRDLRAEGHRVAVLAVDPSSALGSGALLGDRVRMQAAAAEPGVFMRSMSARGAFGGLSRAAGDAVTVLDAMGFDTILVETVGVGQTEVEIATLCPCVLLLHTPAAGDAVQAIKAGVIEIAAVHVVTKPKLGDPAPVQRALAEAAALRHAADPGGWIAPILVADALADPPMTAFHDAIAARFGWLDANPERAAAEADARIRARALLTLRARAERQLALGQDADLVARIRRREADPAELLLRFTG